MKTFVVIVFWAIMVAIPLTFISAAIHFGIQETERVGYCKALDAKYVKSDPDLCVKGSRVVHFF